MVEDGVAVVKGGWWVVLAVTGGGWVMMMEVIGETMVVAGDGRWWLEVTRGERWAASG